MCELRSNTIAVFRWDPFEVGFAQEQVPRGGVLRPSCLDVRLHFVCEKEEHVVVDEASGGLGDERRSPLRSGHEPDGEVVLLQ